MAVEINWTRVDDLKQVIDGVENLGEKMEKKKFPYPMHTRIDGVNVCLLNAAEVKKFVEEGRVAIAECSRSQN